MTNREIPELPDLRDIVASDELVNKLARGETPDENAAKLLGALRDDIRNG